MLSCTYHPYFVLVTGLIWCRLVKSVHPSNVGDFYTCIESNEVVGLFERARNILSLQEGVVEAPVCVIKHLIKEKNFFLVVQIAMTRAFFRFF